MVRKNKTGSTAWRSHSRARRCCAVAAILAHKRDFFPLTLPGGNVDQRSLPSRCQWKGTSLHSPLICLPQISGRRLTQARSAEEGGAEGKVLRISIIARVGGKYHRESGRRSISGRNARDMID